MAGDENMKCAYCGREARGTKEHIISSGILDLFPECYLTFDEKRGVIHQGDPMIKDVCADCNNNKISYIDSYAKNFIGRYFVKNYGEDEQVKIEYNYTMIQKVLLKYAFNDLRSRRDDISYFDEELLQYLMNESDRAPKEYISVLAGLAVNVSPAPDFMFGNLKLRWCKNPVFYENSTIRHINYETGQVFLNDECKVQTFKDLEFSYAFRFNSVQFLLMCWKKDSENIDTENIILKCQYPYTLFSKEENVATLSLCTDESNYHRFEQIHVSWDGLFEVGRMRKLATPDSAKKYLQQLQEAWKEEEKRLKEEHPR